MIGFGGDLPVWLPLVLIFAVVAGLVLWGLFIRMLVQEIRAILFARRDQPEITCPRCGYDLRATPDRCPECGTAR